ncbi:MAG: tRNA uridine-5-carboxymethylaminomethyl(34) synthesis GTPase MnmE [Acidobacteria bacterium RIFCSPLOWO2_12_FULL_67_14]|nr:MAG: tRNA uridine-5-carboxymethylaminomethyl(34) synthesis GTPase MnmE [Acidobacteria bacterium RIFCSPLOWO2_02_FULL_67_21]OFW38185.1 MAG: tRNA uridine-5-carboxymethylaminomethyl(34) synthesis GTPase MnmE [Acidobacteria bacterium RIFCSPLOWO2_12_FULL_67_14]
MFSTEDSIVAIATPPGRGGIGVVRISGASSLRIAAGILDHPEPLRPRHATYTRIRRNGAGPSDEVIATYFPGPRSYTGEFVVEISAHGSPVVLRGILDRAVAAGARLAEPGEFTLRAFLNGKRDLVQAEAVADLIDAATPLQARVAFDQLEGTLTAQIGEIDRQLFDLIARLEASLDFPDEGYHFVEPAEIVRRIGCVVQTLERLLASAPRGRLIREGATVVVAGRPNVGKSSIFNRLVGAERAIVTDVAGTTRDLIAERVDVEGLAVTMVDTAGCREAGDRVEREGVMRAARAREVADVLLVIIDGSVPLMSEDERLLAETAARPRVVVVNKVDLPPARDTNPSGSHGEPDTAHPTTLVRVSARTGAGFEHLRDAIVAGLTGRESLRDPAMISNARHIALLEQARASLVAARASSEAGEAPEEILLADLQAARARFDEVVGTRTSEDVLRHIFERFCIGK